MTERHFDEELKSLTDQILRMGGTTEDMIQKAIRAIVERDADLTQEVFELEKAVNKHHVDIDDHAIRLLARHQPMAVDLRFLSAVMKINSELERVADQTVNVCQTLYYHLFKEPAVPQVDMILRQAEIAQRMLRTSLDAFAKRHVDLAESVLLQEKEEDRLKAQALTRLIELIKKDPSHSLQFVDLILLSKNMERIGDHATNIAEDVIFMVLGKDIRHQTQNLTALPS